MRRDKLLKTTIALILLSIIYTLLVKYIDVKSIGPQDSSVGFASINDYFKNLLDYSKTWYSISKYLGVLPFLIVAFYALIGLKQWYERKSIFSVDKRIVLLGLFYILVGAVYVLFEVVVINYRPFLQEGVLEASYPSSHTMLALCICLSSIFTSKHYIKNKRVLKIFNISSAVLMALIVLTRFLSGVHWFTDIIGGIIISITLVSIYLTSTKYFTDSKERL